MTDLREKIAAEISGWDYERDEDAKFVAGRIVEIVKQAQPKLEWRKNEFGHPERWLFIGNLYVGQVHDHPTPGGRKGYRSWLPFDDEGDRIGTHDTIEEARATVEQAVRKALGWPE